MVSREIILVGLSNAHAADNTAPHRQRYPHPRLHPFEQSSSSLVQKRTQKFRLRVVTPHVGHANGTMPIEQRNQSFRVLQTDVERRRLFKLRRPAHGQGGEGGALQSEESTL